MALYVKDPAVDNLVEQYCALTGLTNKTEAVRRVFTEQLKAMADKETLAQRVERIQHRAALSGFKSGGSNTAADKAFMDNIWSEH